MTAVAMRRVHCSADFGRGHGAAGEVVVGVAGDSPAVITRTGYFPGKLIEKMIQDNLHPVMIWS
jgi:hypothetical protein